MVGETLKQILALAEEKLPAIETWTLEKKAQYAFSDATIVEFHKAFDAWREKQSKRISNINDVLSRIGKFRWPYFAPPDWEDIRALLSKACFELLEEMDYYYDETTGKAAKKPTPKKATTAAAKAYVPTGLPVCKEPGDVLTLLNLEMLKFLSQLPGNLFYKIRKRASTTLPDGSKLKGRLMYAKIYYRRPGTTVDKLLDSLFFGEYDPNWMNWTGWGELRIGESPTLEPVKKEEYIEPEKIKIGQALYPAPTPAPKPTPTPTPTPTPEAPKIEISPGKHFTPPNPIERLFRVPGTDEIFELSEWQAPQPDVPEGFGTRIWIKSAEIFEQMYGKEGWAKVKDITRAELNKYYLMPF